MRITRHLCLAHSSFAASLYLNESWELAERRWGKLLHDFRRHPGSEEVCQAKNAISKVPTQTPYDISKIPDIYDNVKYDMEHNPELCLNHEEQFERMYLCVKNVADVLVPSEYGIKRDGKLAIAQVQPCFLSSNFQVCFQGICTPLMRKLQTDLRRCVDDDTIDENVTRLDPRCGVAVSLNANTKIFNAVLPKVLRHLIGMYARACTLPPSRTSTRL